MGIVVVLGLIERTLLLKISPVMKGFPLVGAVLVSSMIVDFVARTSNRPCVITAEIDLDYVDTVKKQLITLENRRTDLYTLCRTK